MGCEFVDLLTTEVQLLTGNSAVSDHLMMLCPVILQRKHMVRLGSDVRRLLKRRMEMWKSKSFEALFCEAERCAAQWRNRQLRLSDDHVVWVFTRLMLRGRIFEAVYFVTNRARGGVLKPSDIDAKSGKCVFDVLREKYPPSGLVSQDAFVSCSDLPLLVDVDVTSSHVEQVARCLRGSGALVMLILITGSDSCYTIVLN